MHSHFCDVCKTFVAACADVCVHEGPQYCSQHVPPEAHADKDHPYFGARVDDKPTVRMTVKLAD